MRSKLNGYSHIGRALLIGSLILAAGLSGCREERNVRPVEMPETNVLSLRAGWSVVTNSYVRVHASPDAESQIVSHVRRGTLAEVTGKTSFRDTVGSESDNWYQVRIGETEGWIFGTALELYNSRQRAENAARTRE